MSIDPTTGEIDIEEGGLVICPNTRCDEFLASPIGATAHLDVKNQQFATYSFTFKFGTSLFGLSVVFESQKLDSVRLERVDTGTKWENWSEARELERKYEHDRLLVSLLGKPPYKFVWGEIVSVFDSRNGSANINIQYRTSHEKSS
jgi:hypothetical protein